MELQGVFATATDFKDAYKAITFTNAAEIEADLGFRLAYEILSKGLPIQYVTAYTHSVTDESGVVTPSLKEIETLFTLLKDKGVFGDVRFITIGGLAQFKTIIEDESGDSTRICDIAARYALQCAGDRGDAIAVLDYIPKDAAYDSSTVDKWIKNTFGTVASSLITRQGVDFNSSTEVYGTYGAIFAPSFITSINSINNTTISNITLPASIHYLNCFARNHEVTAN